MLEWDPKRWLSAKEVLEHKWFDDVDASISIFNDQEKLFIMKEYTYDISWQQAWADDEEEAADCFTEVDLETFHNSDWEKNASTKSIILAPFNSTKSHVSSFSAIVKNNIFSKHEIMKFKAKVREIDWKYEDNNNSKLDNGVYNKFANNSGNGANLSESSTPSEYVGLESAGSSRNEGDGEKVSLERSHNHSKNVEEQIKCQVKQFCPKSERESDI